MTLAGISSVIVMFSIAKSVLVALVDGSSTVVPLGSDELEMLATR